MDEPIYLTVIAPRDLWPEIKCLLEQHGAEMDEPIALSSPAEAPNFPVGADDIKLGLELVSLTIASLTQLVSLWKSLRELSARRDAPIHVRDTATGKPIDEKTLPELPEADKPINSQHNESQKSESA